MSRSYMDKIITIWYIVHASYTYIVIYILLQYYTIYVSNNVYVNILWCRGCPSVHLRFTIIFSFRQQENLINNNTIMFTPLRHQGKIMNKCDTLSKCLHTCVNRVMINHNYKNLSKTGNNNYRIGNTKHLYFII